MDWAAQSVLEGEDDAVVTAQRLGVTISALLMRCRQLQETLHRSRPRR